MYHCVIRVAARINRENLLERDRDPEDNGKSSSIIITRSGVEIPGHRQRVRDNEEVEGNGLLSGQSQGSFSGEKAKKGEKREEDDKLQSRNLNTERRDGLPFFFFLNPVLRADGIR